ncbi:MAG: GNAT family N-acetyltransferase [Alphaproteobacteria bacterium]
MTLELPDWIGCPAPERVTLKGTRVHLVPPSARDHTEGLFELISKPGEENIWTYMPSGPYPTLEDFQAEMQFWQTRTDMMHFTILEATTKTPLGMMALLNINPRQGSIEIGFIWFTKPLRKTAAATEALFLLMDYALNTLGYRRLEWKCNKNNAASMRAAERLGFTFEGIFRNHMVVKAKSRDSAWFSIIDSEWPMLREAYQKWLKPDNFDTDGVQKNSLEEFFAQK